MFSVIIPLYNKAPYIEKAIQSVLSQTYQEFELIVIDDGSTDESVATIKRINSSEIQIFEQQNQGVAVTRNNGVAIAKFDYIAFLDADDWWEPDFLTEMKKMIFDFPEAALYSCSYYKVKNGKKIPAVIGVDDDFQRGFIPYFQVYARTLWQPVWTGATIIKKTIYQTENGFPAQLKLGEDFYLWVRIADKYPVAWLNRPLSNYNQDVDEQNRAIGKKLYASSQHFIYSDYSDIKSPDFSYLFDKLAVYGLLPYFIAGKNRKENQQLLQNINWQLQPLKYRLYYRILPLWMVRLWFELLNRLYQIKRTIKGK